jgi:hypothetical protein
MHYNISDFKDGIENTVYRLKVLTKEDSPIQESLFLQKERTTLALISMIVRSCQMPASTIQRYSCGYSRNSKRFYINIHLRDSDCNTHVLYLSEEL